MSNPSFNATVGTTSFKLTLDPARSALWLVNDSPTQVIYVNLGAPAVVGQGVRLNPGGDTWETASTADVYVIATAPGANLSGASA